MSLLDGILGQMMGSGAMGGSQGNSPLGSILSSVAGSLGGGAGATAAPSGGLGGLAGLARGALGGGGQSNGGGGLAAGAILAAVIGMVQSQGGISAILNKLQSSGLGASAASWVGTGANQPVSADDLHKALGSGAIGNVASQLGINTQQAGGVLSKVLPELVNQLSPNGTLADNHSDMLTKGLAMLRGLSG